MLRVEWMLNTVHGPVVGERAVQSVGDAVEVIRGVLAETAGRDVDQAAHVEARARIAAHIATSAPAALEADGQWVFRVPAVALTLTAEDG